MKRLLLCLLMSVFASTASAREWFVRQADPNASDATDGSADHPFRSINAAAGLRPAESPFVGGGRGLMSAHIDNSDAPFLELAGEYHGD